jgi:hypothetical protein
MLLDAAQRPTTDAGTAAYEMSGSGTLVTDGDVAVDSGKVVRVATVGKVKLTVKRRPGTKAHGAHSASLMDITVTLGADMTP